MKTFKEFLESKLATNDEEAVRVAVNKEKDAPVKQVGFLMKKQMKKACRKS